jgi:anti-sigma B factor antagonist
MALDIQESVREGVAVVTLKGRLTVGESEGLREKVNQLVAAGRFQVVMDLSALDYIDSTGLGNLVIYYTSLKKHGGALKLVNLNKRNVELLLLTKLHTVFEVFTEVQDAVNSFFPDRVIKRFDVLSFVQQHESES